MAQALLACLLWGGADFLAAIGARYRSAASVQLIIQGTGLVALTVVLPWILTGMPAITAAMAWWAGIAGLTDSVGYLCLYLAMGRGQIGTVAPVAGLGVLVPVVIDLAGGRSLGIVTAVGVAAALIGVTMIARADTGRGSGRPGMLLAVTAALAFGLGFVCVARSAAVDVLATPVLMRLVSVPAAVVLVLLSRHRRAARPTTRTPRWTIVALALAGAAEAGGNLAFGAGSTVAPMGPVAVAASMYPLVTVLLARMLLAERLTRTTRVGAATCLLATGCLALAA